MREELYDPFQDQVACARYRAERDALAQRMEEIASEIDRTLLGVEGIEDAPAMRWMRGLREALGALHSPRTSYEDIEAARWVREHGGLDAVKTHWKCISYYADPVPRSYAEKRIAKLKRQIDENHAALRRRKKRIAELEAKVRVRERTNDELNEELIAMRPRLMPEGMEWPTVDGRKVDFKTPYQPSLGVLEAVSIYSNGACEVMSHDGIIKPVSGIHVVVPAADGEPLEVGQTVYAPRYGYVKCIVLAIEWDVDGYLVEVENEGGCKFRQTPDEFTHTKPERDSWERVEEDAEKDPCSYFGFDGEEICGKCPALGKNCEQTNRQLRRGLRSGDGPASILRALRVADHGDWGAMGRVTDDERREVAARLRNVEMHVFPDAKISYNPRTVEFVSEAVFYDLPYVRGLFARLADLIEPAPERTYHPERIGTAYHSALMCSACKYPLDDVTIYCPHCGARLEGVGR